MFETLVLPVTKGFELTTRILYPAPVAFPTGITAAIVPAAVEDKEPIVSGAQEWTAHKRRP